MSLIRFVIQMHFYGYFLGQTHTLSTLINTESMVKPNTSCTSWVKYIHVHMRNRIKLLFTLFFK